MLERLTDRARRVLVLAQHEARLLHLPHTDAELILLALLLEGEGVAAVALRNLGVDEVRLRELIESRPAVEPVNPSGLPFTDHARKALELSLREALQLGHNYIGTEHILLGLVRQGEGAAELLIQSGVDLVRVRQTVIELLIGYAAAARPAPPTPSARDIIAERARTWFRTAAPFGFADAVLADLRAAGITLPDRATSSGALVSGRVREPD